MQTLEVDGTWDRLGAIALVLHQAATQVWRDADRAEVTSPLHALGLGVYLTRSQACALLPPDYELPDVNLDDLEGLTPLQLLAEAEELTRRLPMIRPDLMLAPQLSVDLCDLIREARGLGY